MRFFLLAFVLFFLSVSIKVLLEPVLPDSFRIDPFLWWVVFWALYCKKEQTAFPAFFLGLLKDLFSTTPLGSYALLYWIAFRFISKNRERFFTESKCTQMLLVLGAGFIVNSLYACLLLMQHYPPEFAYLLQRVVLIIVPTALLTVPAFIVIALISELFGIKRNKKGEWLLPDF